MFSLIREGKVYVLLFFLFLYINVFVIFSFIYLLLDILNVGPLVNSFSFNESQSLFSQKLLNSLYLSARTLFFDGYGYIVPNGWSRIVAHLEETVGFLLPAFFIIKFLPSEHIRMDRNFFPVFKLILRSLLVTLGALLVSLGLEIFLVPNNIIDGGVVGISIIMSYLTGIKLELFLLILNVPFLYLGYRQIGKKFVVTTLFGLSVLSLGTGFLNNVSAPTENPLLASVFGGAFLGIGVGMVIRYGGSLDGTEILGILLNRKTPISVGNVVMFINIFIFFSAGFVFGWDRAMYSLITYFIASKMIDFTIEGFKTNY